MTGTCTALAVDFRYYIILIITIDDASILEPYNYQEAWLIGSNAMTPGKRHFRQPRPLSHQTIPPYKRQYPKHS